MTSLTAPAATPRFEPQLMRRKLSGTLFYGACILAIALTLMTLAILLVDVFARGLPMLRPEFLSGVPSRFPGRAGIFPAIAGSLQMGLIVGLITFPTGVAAAVYLEEYVRDSRWSRILRTNIANLAGVPSIIYGILGLALFARVLGLGFTLLTGALTLSLLILPVVIIASMEAIRAVPDSQREAGYALGATRWQMVRGTVLPTAGPGILTGVILAMARAVGEAAPLLLVGGLLFVTYAPNPLEGGYTVLPLQIYQWATRPQEGFQMISASAIIVLLAVVFVLNALAIIIRLRLSRHIQW